MEDLVIELRQANRSLEDKIARLCEAPFISDAFGQHEARQKLEDLLRERETLSGQVSHLQEAVRTNFSALTSLKQQAAQLREEKETLKRVNDELMKKLERAESSSSELNDKLKMFSGNDDLDVDTLEKALTLVKRRSMAVDRLPFLENVEDNALTSVPSLKRKMEDLQMLNLRLGEDNERLEGMLKMQVGINQDLHKELESLVLVRDKEKSDMAKRNTDFEQLAIARLEKIHKLEAQLRELTYGLGKSLRIKGGHAGDRVDVDDSMLEDSGDPSNLLAQLLSDRKDVDPDENLLEIWVKSATFDEGVMPPGSSSFVVVDFFDYESQATPLICGSKPVWDFAATYKVRVDDFFLRFLATDSVRFDINMVREKRSFCSSSLKLKLCLVLYRHIKGNILSYLSLTFLFLGCLR